MREADYQRIFDLLKICLPLRRRKVTLYSLTLSPREDYRKSKSVRKWGDMVWVCLWPTLSVIYLLYWKMSFHQMRPGSSSLSTCLVWLGTGLGLWGSAPQPEGQSNRGDKSWMRRELLLLSFVVSARCPGSLTQALKEESTRSCRHRQRREKLLKILTWLDFIIHSTVRSK